jgi:hypothetical protein
MTSWLQLKLQMLPSIANEIDAVTDDFGSLV